MEPGKPAGASPHMEGATPDRHRGLYVYCIADGGQKARLGPIGIGSFEVYSVSYRRVSAVVHDCPAEPYKSTDPQVVEGWVMAHQRVVDAAWERWGTVLPLGFDTIVKGQGDGGPQEAVRTWLAGEYQSLRHRIETVRGKAEYGVQVFWEPQVVARDIAANSDEIRRLEEEIRSKGRGTAYLLRQKVESTLRREMETRASECFRDFYQRIRQHVSDIRLEKIRKVAGEKQMIINLSCLAYRERSSDLGNELESIDRIDGFSVRFTGPWPPYSFVGG